MRRCGLAGVGAGCTAVGQVVCVCACACVCMCVCLCECVLMGGGGAQGCVCACVCLRIYLHTLLWQECAVGPLSYISCYFCPAFAIRLLAQYTQAHTHTRTHLQVLPHKRPGSPPPARVRAEAGGPTSCARPLPPPPPKQGKLRRLLRPIRCCSRRCTCECLLPL